MSVWIE